MAGFNGSGQFSFTYSWTNDAANGVPITASRMDGQFNDAVSGFDLCITRDGQGKASATQLPDTDNSYNFGSQSFRWGNGYFVALAGTVTNDDAATGFIGEYVEGTLAQASATLVTNNTPKTVVSISLTAGDWDVTASIGYHGPNDTTVAYFVGSISLTDNTTDTTGQRIAYQVYNNLAVFNISSVTIFPVGTTRISLAAPATVYLVAQSGFATDTNSAFGEISARRAR